MNTASTIPHMPLFDRLGGKLAISDDQSASLQSLRHDLIRLFNVRNGLTIEEFLGDAPNALHYGLPDTLGLSPQSGADLARWEQVVARAIVLYEPRLANVHVHITQDAVHPTSARIDIDAAVALGWHLTPVHFHVLMDDRAARAGAA